MLQAAMEKMKKDCGLQIKQKDDLTREISLKGVADGITRMVKQGVSPAYGESHL